MAKSGIAEEDKEEICNLHEAGMGSKKIDKLPQFVEKDYGYNRIQRLFKKCPKILSKSRPQSPTISAPRGIRTSSPYPSSPRTLNGAGTRSTSAYPDSPPPDLNLAGSETFDDGDDSDDYESSADYDTPVWVQPPPLNTGLPNPVDLVARAVNMALSSRFAVKATEFADKFARSVLPDYTPEVTQPENSNLDRTQELAEKHQEKVEDNQTEIELEDADDTAEISPGNCSCALNNQISNIEDLSGQNVDTVDASSIGNVQGKEEGPSEQSLDKGVAVTSATFEPSAMPIEKQGLSNDASVAGDAGPSRSSPATVVTVSSLGVDTKTDQSLESSTTSTTESSLPSPEDKKSESRQDSDSNKKNSLSEQPSGNKQTSADSSVGIQEFAKAETRPPVNVGNLQTQPLQPFDPVKAEQEPSMSTSGGLEQQQHPTPPTLLINNHPTQIPESDNPPLTEPPDDKMDDKSHSSEAESRTSESNQPNFDPIDYVVPVTLGGLALALLVGVIKSARDQNKNKQPEAHTEVDTRTDSNPVVDGRKKPPPSLYTIQPQGETTGNRIF